MRTACVVGVLMLAAGLALCCGPAPSAESVGQVSTSLPGFASPAPTAGLALTSEPTPTGGPAPTGELAPTEGPAPTGGLTPTASAAPPTPELTPTGGPAPTRGPAPTATPTIRRSVVGPKDPPRAAAPQPDSECGSGPPPASLDEFAAPETITYGGETYILVGRTLTVNFVLQDSEGTASMGDLVLVRAESCSINFQLRYDWVYTESYSKTCPHHLSDFELQQSIKKGLLILHGRKLYIDGKLIESEGTATGDLYEESGFCEGHHWRYLMWVSERLVPEASTLWLLASGASALAGRWLHARRRRAGRRG